MEKSYSMRFLSGIYNSCPFGVEGGMLDLLV